jgi:hypothetical protein
MFIWRCLAVLCMMIAIRMGSPEGLESILQGALIGAFIGLLKIGWD